MLATECQAASGDWISKDCHCSCVTACSIEIRVELCQLTKSVAKEMTSLYYVMLKVFKDWL